MPILWPGIACELIRESNKTIFWGEAVADLLFGSVSGLLTAIRGPPPPRVAHSTPLGPLYLGTHGLFFPGGRFGRGAGFCGFAAPLRGLFQGRLHADGGFPVPRRKTHRRVPSPNGLKKYPGKLSTLVTIFWLAQRPEVIANDGRRKFCWKGPGEPMQASAHPRILAA